MLKPTRSRRYFFEKGKKQISLIIAGFGVVGGALDFLVYEHLYHQGASWTSWLVVIACGGALIAFAFNLISYQILYLLSSWSILISVFAFHLYYYPHHPSQVQFSEHMFLRDLFFLTCFLPLTAFIGTLYHTVFQSIVILALLALYALMFKTPFIYKNAPFLLLVEGGGMVWVIFLARSLHRFVNALHLHRKNLEELNKEITNNISFAKNIQQSVLPPSQQMSELLGEYFVLNRPRDIVSGDFYWVTRTQNRLLFAVADCTGHGVSAALVSFICSGALNRSIREYGLKEPGPILDLSRELITGQFGEIEGAPQDGMDIAVCSITDHKLTYAGAHNPLWLVRHSALPNPVESLDGETRQLDSEDGRFRLYEIKADKQTVGRSEKPVPFTDHEVTLEKGDMIYIFTDGYIDQFGGEQDKKFKSVRLKKLILGIHELSMKNQRIRLTRAFNNWKGQADQVDDVCILGVRV